MNGHCAILAIFVAQEFDGSSVGDAMPQDSRFAEDEHVRQPAPIFLVVIDHQRDRGISFDIAQSLQLNRAFGLFVDGRVEILAVENEADRNDVGLAGLVRGGEMRDAGGAKKARGASGQFQSFQSSNAACCLRDDAIKV